VKYTISEISEIIHAKQIGNENSDIQYLIIDSRNISSSQNALFFAIRGDRNDGHQFIEELYNKGVKNFVVEQVPENHSKYKSVNFLVVSNVLEALQNLASHHRKQFSYPVIGITGSNGKTIVKEWLYQILHSKVNIVRSPKSFNSQVGVPLSVWLMNSTFNIAVFEAGISLPGEMEKLEKVILPSIGLITNIGESHQENFIDYKHKAKEKLKLFKNSDLIIYCKDHEIIDQLISEDPDLSKKQKFTWSEKSESTIQLISKSKKADHTILELVYKSKQYELSIPFTDNASVEDAIHVIACLFALGYEITDFKSQIESLLPVAMRMELKKGLNECTIINDSYNSDLNSLNIALNYLSQQNQHSKKIVILSDILQSGKSDKALYSEVSGLIKKYNVDQIIGIGTAILSQADVFDIQKSFYSNTNEFLTEFSKKTFSDSAILLKGSRNFSFEKISAILEEKIHLTVLEIDLNALVHNLNYFKSKLNQNTKIMVMVKALSYGIGTHEIASILQYQRVDYLGVAFTDEGVALREAGIKLPIIVMNPEQNSFNLMIEHNLEPEIYSFSVLRNFLKALENIGIPEYPIHIKLDTGMHRLGFMSHEIDLLIEELLKSKNSIIASIFSHLAASDEGYHDSFTLEQIGLFEELSNKITSKLQYPVIRHVLNSAGIERFPECQFEMVRLGIGLYGISSTNQNQLETVSSLKSTVIQIKQVQKDETIGYSRNATALNDMTIAIVPVGYADGLNRKLGNGNGKLFINGYIVPIVGNICMDMCMADITGCIIHEGDVVEVFGKEISVKEIAEILETIPYEIFAGIPSRVKRVYYQE